MNISEANLNNSPALTSVGYFVLIWLFLRAKVECFSPVKNCSVLLTDPGENASNLVSFEYSFLVTKGIVYKMLFKFNMLIWLKKN